MNRVYSAVVSVCAREACATVRDLEMATGLSRCEVERAAKALHREGRVRRVTRSGVTFVNPIDSFGNPLVCGTWCRA